MNGKGQEFGEDDGMSDFIVDDASDLGEEEQENENDDQGRIVDSKHEVKKRKRASGAAGDNSSLSSLPLASD